MFSLQEAAEVLGVHYQTAYGWVRSGVLPARKAGRDYQVSDADLRALRAERSAGRPPRREVRVRDWAAQADLLYGAIVSGAETAARSRLQRLAVGVRMIEICEQVIGPALRRVGADWAAGTVTIAVEHRATAICERLIASQSGRQPRGRPRGVAVVATPPEERHALPALMAAACLREDRWLVHHLACDLPAGEVGRLATSVGASLVVLSSATSDAGRRAADEAARLTAADPALRVLVGVAGASLYDLVRLARATGGSRLVETV